MLSQSDCGSDVSSCLLCFALQAVLVSGANLAADWMSATVHFRTDMIATSAVPAEADCSSIFSNLLPVQGTPPASAQSQAVSQTQVFLVSGCNWITPRVFKLRFEFNDTAWDRLRYPRAGDSLRLSSCLVLDSALMLPPGGLGARRQPDRATGLVAVQVTRQHLPSAVPTRP